MDKIKAFHDFNGKETFYQNVKQNTIDKYQDILPKFLIKIWKDKGLSHYKDGFFWLVNPDEFEETISFFKTDISKIHVVMRTGFGGLIYLNEAGNDNPERKFNYLCPIYNNVTPLTDKLDVVMNGWLTTEEVYAPMMFSHIYEQARKRLPIPAADECYGFVPALALGGDFDADNIKIVKMKEHLSMLSQLK